MNTTILAAFAALLTLAGVNAQEVELEFGSSSLGGDGIPFKPVPAPRIVPRGLIATPQITFLDATTLPLNTDDGLPQSPTHFQALEGLMERAARGKTTGIGEARTQADMGPLRYPHLLRCAATPLGNRYTLWKGEPDGGPDYGNMVSPAPVRIFAPAGVTVIPAQVSVKIEGFRWTNGDWQSIGVLRNVTLSSLGDARWVTNSGPNNVAGDGDDIKPVIQDPNAPAQILTYGGPAVNIVASTAAAIPGVLNTLRNGAYTFRVTATVPYAFNGQNQNPWVQYKDVQGTVDLGEAALVRTPATVADWDLSDSVNGLIYALEKSNDLVNWESAGTFTGNGNVVHLGAIMSADMGVATRKQYRVTWRGNTLPPIPAP